ncbi:MAG: VWA domain-containing protein [Actinomycetota bacterium]|nr:VWA domain-containing protein [Actinomycetota bacterium]
MSLFDHHVAFVSALRETGITVSVAEGLDATAAIKAVALLDREQLRAAYAATLVKRQIHRASFDHLFDLYFPLVTGVGGLDAAPGQAPTPPRAPPPPWEVNDPLRLELRERLSQYLRDGDEQLATVVAREAVAGFGALPGAGGGAPSWSPLTVLDRLSPQTLLAALLEQFLHGQEEGGLAERAARTTINGRLRRFEELVRADARRRLAEQTSLAEVASSGLPRSLDTIAFLGANREEMAALRRELQPLARRLAARLAVSHRRGRRGALDFRRTIRASLSSGGVPLQTLHRPRRPTKTDLVILCDVSDSVTSFAHFTLLLVYALREQFSRVRTFAFIDDLDEVTRFFGPGVDVVEAVASMAGQAKVAGLFGNTDYGRAFELFDRRYPQALTRRTSLLILGDARSNYGHLGLGALESMVDRARHAHWLNPERRGLWDSGDSEATRFGRILPMVECRNLAQLSEFVRNLD